MNILEKYDKPFAYIGIVIYLSMALQFLLLWINPSINDANEIYRLTILLGFDVMIAFLSPALFIFSPSKFIKYLLILWVLLIVYASSRSLGGSAIFIIFLIRITYQFKYLFSEVDIKIQGKDFYTSLLSVASFFILFPIISNSSDFISHLGLTEEYVILSGYNEIDTDGLFQGPPHIPMFFGVTYYTYLALVDFFLTRKYYINQRRSEKNKISNLLLLTLYLSILKSKIRKLLGQH